MRQSQVYNQLKIEMYIQNHINNQGIEEKYYYDISTNILKKTFPSILMSGWSNYLYY